MKFESYYKTYPKHVDRKPCEKAWIRIGSKLKPGEFGQKYRTIMGGLKKQLPKMNEKIKQDGGVEFTKDYKIKQLK